MANSVDPDQTRSSLIWVYTVCSGLPVQNPRIIMVMGGASCISLSNQRYLPQHSLAIDLLQIAIQFSMTWKK